MFSRWGSFVARRRRWVLGLALLFVALAVVWGTGVFKDLVNPTVDDPGAPSARASQLLDDRIGHTAADVIVLYSNPHVTVDQPDFRRAVESSMRDFPPDVTSRVVTYWSSHASDLVSKDRHATYAVVSLKDENKRIAMSAYDPLRNAAAASGYRVQIGGANAVDTDISDRVSHDIARAEMISMPVLLLLLVFVFGSVVAALMPMLVGGFAILGAFTSLRLISQFTDVSIFSINIVTIAGLGLAIDYGLFIVSRFREELGRGLTPPQAISRTMATAGRTVAISSVTVAIALAGLLIFPQTFLRSMGMGGIAAVLIAAIGALTILPAVLSLLGTRVDAWSVRPLLHRFGIRAPRPQADGDHGFWYRFATSVMRRPIAYFIAVAAVLVVLAMPFLHVRFGGVDARVLPTSAESRQTSDALLADFPSNDASPIMAAVELTHPVATPAGQAALQSYLGQVRSLDGVVGADVTAARGDTARVDVRYQGEALDARTKALVGEVRALSPPAGVNRVLVGGETAQLVDQLHRVGERLPWMALIIGLATFALLFLAFGSVVLPIKAIIVNVLSLGATFGVVTWIFQEGHFSGLLNFTSTGTVDATQPILVLAIVFGLSMDYEVFLLSRVREQYDVTGDNTKAVASGLQRTGRIITSAAMLLIVVIALFSASSVSFIKLIGVAMAVGLIIDATIVRLMLVPATMRLLGRANWWAPGPLRRLYSRYGLREDEVVEPEPQPVLVGT